MLEHLRHLAVNIQIVRAVGDVRMIAADLPVTRTVRSVYRANDVTLACAGMLVPRTNIARTTKYAMDDYVSPGVDPTRIVLVTSLVYRASVLILVLSLLLVAPMLYVRQKIISLYARVRKC